VLANHPHGFKSIHSRHEDVQEQQIEIFRSGTMPGPFRPSSAVTTLWPGARATGGRSPGPPHRHPRQVFLAKVKSSPGSAGIKSTAGCEFCRILMLPATASPAGTYRLVRQKAGIKRGYSACCRADKVSGAAPAGVIRPRQPAAQFRIWISR
jgi:hypothetical protein